MRRRRSPAETVRLKRRALTPDTRNILQFTVVRRRGLPDLIPFSSLPTAISMLTKFLAQDAAISRPAPTNGRIYGKTLAEGFDQYGRLLQRIGTTAHPDGLNFMDPRDRSGERW